MRPLIGITAGPDTIEEYVRAIEIAGGDPRSLRYDAGTLPDDLGELAGILFSGGMDIAPERYGDRPHPRTEPVAPERDAYEADLVRAAFDRRLPTLAICRGMQVANVAFGGTLHQHVPDVYGVGVLHRDERNGDAFRGLIDGHVLDVEPDSRLAGLVGPTLVTGSRHHQAVDRVAASFRAVARARDGLVEALEPRATGPFWLGVQWHPESTLRLDEGASLSLFRALVDAAR